MTVDVRPVVLIHRPRGEVAAFMFDPANDLRYELEDAPDGTTVAIHAVGSPGRFFAWATPVMAGQVRRSIAAELARLRRCLESDTKTTP